MELPADSRPSTPCFLTGHQHALHDSRSIKTQDSRVESQESRTLSRVKSQEYCQESRVKRCCSACPGNRRVPGTQTSRLPQSRSRSRAGFVRCHDIWGTGTWGHTHSAVGFPGPERFSCYLGRYLAGYLMCPAGSQAYRFCTAYLQAYLHCRAYLQVLGGRYLMQRCYSGPSPR